MTIIYKRIFDEAKNIPDKIDLIFSNYILAMKSFKKLNSYTEDWKRFVFDKDEIKFLKLFCNDRNLIGKKIYRMGNVEVKNQFESYSLKKNITNYFRGIGNEMIIKDITNKTNYIDVENYFKIMGAVDYNLSLKDNLNKLELKLSDLTSDMQLYDEKEIIVFN